MYRLCTKTKSLVWLQHHHHHQFQTGHKCYCVNIIQHTCASLYTLLASIREDVRRNENKSISDDGLNEDAYICWYDVSSYVWVLNSTLSHISTRTYFSLLFSLPQRNIIMHIWIYIPHSTYIILSNMYLFLMCIIHFFSFWEIIEIKSGQVSCHFIKIPDLHTTS